MIRRNLLTLSLALAAAPAAAVAGGPSGGEAAEPTYTPLGTLTATIVRTTGRRGVLSVETGIDVPDTALRAQAVQALPRLRSAYSDVLRRFGAGLTPGAVPDADRLSRELQAATDSELGRSGGHVLMGTILVL